MKGFVFVFLVLGLWLAYKQHKLSAPTTVKKVIGQGGFTQGAQSTLAAGFGSSGNFPNSGNNSPGSGVRTNQPLLTSSWALGRNYGSYGSTGPIPKPAAYAS